MCPGRFLGHVMKFDSVCAALGWAQEVLAGASVVAKDYGAVGGGWGQLSRGEELVLAGEVIEAMLGLPVGANVMLMALHAADADRRALARLELMAFAEHELGEASIRFGHDALLYVVVMWFDGDGRSDRALAERLGVSQPTVNRYKRKVWAYLDLCRRDGLRLMAKRLAGMDVMVLREVA